MTWDASDRERLCVTIQAQQFTDEMMVTSLREPAQNLI